MSGKELVLQVTKRKVMVPTPQVLLDLKHDDEEMPAEIPQQDMIYIPVRDIDNMQIVLRDRWDE